MFSPFRRLHPVVVFAIAIFAGYLAVFLLAAFAGHDHEQQCHDHECAAFAWFGNLSIILPAVLVLQLCFLYFRQGYFSFRSPHSFLFLPEGRASRVLNHFGVLSRKFLTIRLPIHPVSLRSPRSNPRVQKWGSVLHAGRLSGLGIVHSRPSPGHATSTTPDDRPGGFTCRHNRSSSAILADVHAIFGAK